MAAAVGIVAWEAVAAAAAAISALWLSTPQGRKASKETAEQISRELDKIRDSSRDSAKTVDLAPPVPKVECLPRAVPREVDRRRKCGPEQCTEAVAAVRKHTAELKERLRELRDDKYKQPWFPPIDPNTGRPKKSERKTRWGHVVQIEQRKGELSGAIQTYYECGCTGLSPEEIREAGDLILQDPLEGVVP